MPETTIIKTEQPKEREPFDRKTYLLRFAQASLKELNALMAQEVPDLKSLEPKLMKAVKKWLREPTCEYDLGFRFWSCEKFPTHADKIKKELLLELQAGFIAGRIKLGEEPVIAAKKYFYNVAEFLAGRPEFDAPAELRKDSTDALRIICRNWVLSHALDYVDFRHKDDAYCVFDSRWLQERTWAAGGVISLGRHGTIEDIPAIDLISDECREGCMEGYCSSARRKIINRSVILAMLTNNRELVREAGLGAEISDEIIADRLSPILDVTGLSFAIQAMPGMRAFAAMSPNPFLRELELEEIQSVFSDGLKGRFNGGVDGGSPVEEHVYNGCAFEFAQKHGLIEKIEDNKNWWADEYVLTEKGKSVLKALFQGVDSLRIDLVVPPAEEPAPKLPDILPD